MNHLEFGIFDTTAIPDTSPSETAAAFEEHLSDAQLAERCGFSSFFFIEHQNAGFDCVSASAVYLTALARATRKIRIGTMIFQIPLHHPIRLAQDTATIDHLSRGRLDVGIGFGTRAREFAPWQINFDTRRSVGHEAIEVLLKAWTQRVVNHAGEHFVFAEALPQPHPYQKPYPPVWLGAHSPSSYEYAAMMNFNVGQIFEVETVVAEKFAHWRNAMKQYSHSGPRARAALVRHVHVAKTDELARQQAEPYMLRGIQGPASVARAEVMLESSSPETRERARVFYETTKSADFWLDEGLAFVGSPETVSSAIRLQQQRAGYDVLLLNRFDEIPHDLYTASMKLFGEEVIPRFASPELSSSITAQTA
jgi:alkanesulfonate monooxygenase SsuD/methylene tetrahydromethanopterin reductase-like flavin-dependent oxidoreductase (luciferase family)